MACGREFDCVHRVQVKIVYSRFIGVVTVTGVLSTLSTFVDIVDTFGYSCCMKQLRLRTSEEKAVLFCVAMARNENKNAVFFNPRDVLQRIIELGSVAFAAQFVKKETKKS